MQRILYEAKTQIKKELPFVLYANPNSNKLNAYFQKNDELEVFKGQSGFVFAPFSNIESYIISLSNSNFLSESIEEIEIENILLDISIDQKAKKNFEDLVNKGIVEINNNLFEKVVLSRKVVVPVKMDFEATFLRLLQSYNTAFRYLFYHPKIGMWMGATPEQLLKVEGDKISTVALAGTQLYKDSLIWEEKELQEQQFVSDFIIHEITPFVKNITISEPFTAKAGTLAHIKTTISAYLKEKESANKLLFQIHPTPAVCGLPKKEAMAFVLQNEGYDRKFYSGFLGEWNIKDESNLFVNLRCMEVEEEKINLYVGCGITKDSNPEKEFFETENKLVTMLKIIKV